MEKDKLIHLLEEIHSEIRTMRGIKKEDQNIHAEWDVYLYDLQMCFLIFLAYTESFGDDFPNNCADMEILLNQKFSINNESDNKKKALVIWEYIKTKTHESFPEWMELVKSYHLNDYRTSENDDLLLKWANENFLFNSDYSFFAQYSHNVRLLLDIIDNTSDVLGIKLSMNRLLVLGDNCDFYKRIFMGQMNFDSYTLCPEDDYIYCCSQLNTFFFLNNEKFQIIKRESKSKEVFPFKEAQFDTIFSFVDNGDSEEVLNIERIIAHTSNNGCGVIFGQQPKRLIEKGLFEENDFPLIADYFHYQHSSKLYVYRRDRYNTKIRSMLVDINESCLIPNVYNQILENYILYITNHRVANDYQELTKEDYLYSRDGDVSLPKIFRELDQMDFVWCKVEDIIRVKSNHNIPYKEIPKEKIIRQINKALSNNPFNYSLSEMFLLNGDVHDELFSRKIKEEAFVIEKENLSYLLKPLFHDEKYDIIATKLALGKQVPDKETNQLECRIMTSPGLLWNGGNMFCKVNCSKEHPICYEYCFFVLNDLSYTPECQACLNEIELSEEFDEGFIVYQFAKHYSKYSDYILVAPTKEEQHNYYIKKKEEYRLVNRDLVKEIRHEERQALSADFHYLKHDAAQYLSSINSTALSFIKILQKGSLSLNDSLSSGYTVKDALDNITKSVSLVTEFLNQMTLLTDTIPKRKTNISHLLENFVKGCLKKDFYKVNLTLAENMENVSCLLDDRINKVFTNILSNAERHAFTDFNRSDYELLISAHKENNVVIITFANNGTPPDPSLTEEGYFTKGLHVGRTGHKGYGGSIIRDTINAQDGIIHLHLNKDNKYPFIIEIKLKIEND